ncbi:MAG: MATE family efflux transporter [Lachnospiraceae bacterium]|nr:MATE family efflux transporter [Lachnospiraceae bacterium]
MRKKYMRYIFPSMLSFLLTGIYSIVDGIFVGRAMGDPGLAAINIVWPLVALIISLGTGIGMGASVVVSLNHGAGNDKKALLAEGNAFFLLFTGSVLLTLLLLLFGRPLLVLLGAKGELLAIALTYLRYMLIGGIIQVFATGLVPLMRNHGASFYAMCSMGAGCITNIVLDYYLVIAVDMGIKGAALATVFGQVLTLIMCGVFFLQKKHRIPLSLLKPDLAVVKSILRVAASPFGLTYLPSVTIIFMNLQALKYGGEEAVSAYAVLAYIISFMELLVQGIGDGSQPLLSLSEGSGDRKALKTYAKWTFLLGIGFGIAGAVVFFLSRNFLPRLYGTSPAAARYIIHAAPAFSLIMALYGLTKPAVSYLYATHKEVRSAVLVYGEILLTLALVFILPLFLELDGVWYTIPAVQGILGISCLFFLRK